MGQMGTKLQWEADMDPSHHAIKLLGTYDFHLLHSVFKCENIS